jgi:NADH pyrophosphatase NudC (nudix superfamily)
VSAGQLVRLVVALGAALMFVLAGSQMTSLKSEAGNSVAEAFDNAMGVFSYGMAALALALGIPATTVGKTSSNVTGPVAAMPADTAPLRRQAVPVAGWDPAVRTCPSCGKQVADGRETYCNHCGQPLLVVHDPS